MSTILERQKNKGLILYHRIVYLSLILLIILGPISVSGEEDEPINWITSRSVAIEKGLSEGKYILMVAGSSGCPYCLKMRYELCESNDPPYPIKDVILENYVPWYCDVDSSSEYCYYADCNTPIPCVRRINPSNPYEFIDGGVGLTSSEIFYNFLMNGLGDLDYDGMPDEWEREYGLDVLVDDAAGDIDGDDATNLDEYNAETYPDDPDSDDDGMPDGWEIQYELDPLVDDADEDADGDNFPNLEEYLEETIPNDANSHPTKFMPWLPLLLEGE